MQERAGVWPLLPVLVRDRPSRQTENWARVAPVGDANHGAEHARPCRKCDCETLTAADAQ
jgi:hypothetical protein